MDVFGFGAVLDRIEDHFGRRVCGAFLLLLGLTAVVLCLNAIITLGFIPIRDFIFSQRTLTDALMRLSAGAVLGGMGSYILSYVVYRHFSKKVEAVADNSRAILQEAEAKLEEARATLDKAMRVVGEESDCSDLE